jgi:hypothetical protein
MKTIHIAMKKSFTFLLLLSILAFGCKNTRPAPGLKITHVATLGGQYYCDTTHFIFVKSTLFNNSDDTVKFESMSCSYMDGFLTDSKDISLEKNTCYHNLQELIVIPPHKSFTRFLNLLIPNKSRLDWDWTQISFRIGFNFVYDKNAVNQLLKVNNTNHLFDESKISDMKNMIWSNKVNLSELQMNSDN